MVDNLPETRSTEGDMEAFKELLKSEFKLSVKVQRTTRLGRSSNDNPRLLRVQLEAMSEKKQILARAIYTSEHYTYGKVHSP